MGRGKGKGERGRGKREWGKRGDEGKRKLDRTRTPGRDEREQGIGDGGERRRKGREIEMLEKEKERE